MFFKKQLANDDESFFKCWPDKGLNNLLYWYNRFVQTNQQWMGFLIRSLVDQGYIYKKWTYAI
jgi:hypothetical protein